ncbi:MAG TPA: ABC transporter permease subunit [Firmicutes bacterium]|jgi:ABC-2 type transport system permease protein|nr:ABC transporter permease subunit [Bacillota bacterium]
MNLFLRELRAHRRSLIIWCLGMLAMVGGGMSKYSGMAGAGQSLNSLFASLPKSLQVIFGVGDFDLGTAMGFYAVLYLYIAVIGAVHAAMLGAEIIAKEERDKTVEFLLAKPVSRHSIISAKLIAGLVNLIVLNLFTFTASIVIMSRYDQVQAVAGDIGRLTAGLFLLQLIFFTVGTGMAATNKNAKAAAPRATAILLAAFLVAVATGLSNDPAVLKYLTPFEYYSAQSILVDGVAVTYHILTVIIIAVMIALTYAYYQKRDMNV